MLIAFSLFGISVTLFAQDLSLIVKDQDGSESAILLSDVQKLTFESSTMVVAKTDGNTETFAFSDMDYFYFGELTGTGEAMLASEMKLYPNPVKDALSIEFVLQENAAVGVEIITVNGSTTAYSSQHAGHAGTNVVNLNVEKLLAGMYICRVKSGEATKSIKFYKQ